MDIMALHPLSFEYHKLMKASQGSLMVNWSREYELISLSSALHRFSQ